MDVAKQVLDAYQHVAGRQLNAFTHLLDKSRALAGELEAKHIRIVEQASALIARYRQTELSEINLLRSLPLYLDENSLSDIFAQILKESPTYAAGRNILITWLFSLNVPEAHVIANELAKPDVRYRVHREFDLGYTIPDIAIVGDTFVIFIENKLRFGLETFTDDHQTNRQARALREYAERHGIEKTVAILLSPDRSVPINKVFVSATYSSLVQIILPEIEKTGDSLLSSSAQAIFNLYDFS
ncbi:hypothetical protein [Turneriella parva]|uniref:hypothetical protein n=1 Tax=Turneriella parva TaxID=29510 RepID=UPI0012F6BABD|nr:hypothetical protein [Turneriella parva]